MIPFGKLRCWLIWRPETEYTNIRILLMGRAGAEPGGHPSRLRRTCARKEGRTWQQPIPSPSSAIGPIMGFRALGLDTYPVTSVEEARKTVHDLAKTNCAVIYLTETLAKDMADVLDRYKDNIQPAIILIPGREGSLGIGKREHPERHRTGCGCGYPVGLKEGFHFAPSAHPILCFAPGNREPGLETALLVPPQAALRLFPL